MIKKIVLAIVILVMLFIVGSILTIIKPSSERVDPITYFGEFDPSWQNMVFNDERVDWEEPAIVQEDEIFIQLDWLRAYITDYIYYDEIEGIVSITNLEDVIRIDMNTNTMTVNKEEVPLTIDVMLKNNQLYVSEVYIEQEYAVNFELGNDRRLVIATTNQEDVTLANVKRDVKIRTHPDLKKPIVDEIVKGEEVMIYGDFGEYWRIRNENGMLGYVEKKYIEEIGAPEPLEAKVYTAKPIANPLDGKVRMVWDQMTVRTEGNWGSSQYTYVDEANVISPTWFEFADENGTLIDRGTVEYSQQAQARGLQVWALMSHNFSEPQFTREILNSTSKRQYVIDQLLDATERYDIQGINIDIENIQPDFSDEWVQFMRELYPQMQAMGKTVSVDIYVPSAWSTHYEREKISEVVDYFMVMAYDQYWSGSEEPGPTAGLTWVEESIIANLQEVPAEKLVLGIPTFVRVWEEEDEQLSSKAYGMQAAQNIANTWGVEPTYDVEHQQKYVQYENAYTTYHIWIEDDETIEKRVNLINEYDLAGYSIWKLGLETNSIWNELDKMTE